MGVGAAGGGVVAAAVVRDLFGGQPLVKMLARMGLVTGAAPVLAPLIGSQLLHVLDWRGLFVALALYGAAALVLAAVGIGETRRGSGAARAVRSVRSRYGAVLGDRVFLGAAVVGGMQFAGIFAYLSVSPFLLQQVYGMTPQQYGFTFAINSVGLIAGSQLSARIMRRTGPQWVLVGTVTAELIAGVVLLATAGAGAPLPVVLVPLFVFMSASGFAFPAVQVLGLIHHGEEAGTAASLLGASNFGLAAIASPVVGLLGSTTGVSIGIVVSVSSVVAMVGLWALIRPRSVPAIA
jgi:DHA1 family bicyclomycin/chloramphenicol resistance-like MFS transporter